MGWGPEHLQADKEEPGSSPHASATGGSPGGRSAKTAGGASAAGSEPSSPLVGFFEDELRGYRLLKACHLGYQVGQQVLTLTGNSTSFQPIRQALKSLYDEGMAEASSRRPRHTWWAEAANYEGASYDSWGDGWYEDTTYYPG